MSRKSILILCMVTNVHRKVDTVDSGIINVEKSVSVCLPDVIRTSTRPRPHFCAIGVHLKRLGVSIIPQIFMMHHCIPNKYCIAIWSGLKPSATKHMHVLVSVAVVTMTVPVAYEYQIPFQQQQQQQQPSVIHLNPDTVNFNANQQSLSSDQLIQQVMEMQWQQNEQVLSAHQQITCVMSLPLPGVSKFVGDVMEYHTFILAFGASVVSHAMSDADRMYFLQIFLLAVY